MKTQEIKIKNLGLIPSLNVKLPNAGLVYVKAKNEKGKSTFIRSLATMLSGGNPDNMLSIGKKDGYVEQRFKAANGEEYVLRMDLDPTNKKDRFTLLSPNGKVTKRIADVKDVFGYNDVSVEDFMDFGKTEDGKRKQVEILLNLLSKKDRELYENLCKDEKEAYTERTLVGREKTKKEGAVNTSFPTMEERQEADLVPILSEEIAQLEENLHKFDEADLMEQHIAVLQDKVDDCDTRLQGLREDYKNSQTEVERLKALIVTEENKQKKIKETADSLKFIREGYVEEMNAEKESLKSLDLEKKKAIEESIKEKKSEWEEAYACMQRVETYETLKKELGDVVMEYEKWDKRIKDIRFEKKNIMTKELPIQNLIVEDGVLYYEKDGNLFGFNEKETATSKLLFKTIEIILAINKNVPMVMISRGGDMDAETLKNLHKLGIDMDSLFLMEMVGDNDEVQVVGYEELE